MPDIPNEPAGRLLRILEQFQRADAPMSLGEWWQEIATRMVLGDGDKYTARGEAGALFRDVEAAVRALPPDDNPDTYLSTRELWARPIFGWQLHDAVNVRQPPGSLIDENSLNWLNSISNMLKREAPEYYVRVPANELFKRLDKIYDELAQLLTNINHTPEVSSAFKIHCRRRITDAMEDVVYVRFRGLAPLYRNTHTLDDQLTLAESEAERRHPNSQLSVFAESIRLVRSIVADVEAIVAPTAMTVALALTTGDPAVSISGGVMTRAYLKSRSSENIEPASERLGLPWGAEADGDQTNS